MNAAFDTTLLANDNPLLDFSGLPRFDAKQQFIGYHGVGRDITLKKRAERLLLTRNEQFTLQLALNAFQGDLVTQWHYLLAMTVITLLPITLVFAFLQKYITQGIASAGVK